MSGYRPEWLDELLFRGEVAWGRLFGGGKSALRSTPIALFPRRELDSWLALAAPVSLAELSWPAQALRETLEARGALFTDDLARVHARAMLPSDLERGLLELVSFGLVASDSFASLRELLRPPHRRKGTVRAAGRWSLFRKSAPAAGPEQAKGSERADPEHAEFAARVLLRRYGVLFRSVLARERIPVPWRDLARACRLLELRGEIRGGRFVSGYAGEQFALPEAIPLLRAMRHLPRVEAESSNDAPQDRPELFPGRPEHRGLSRFDPVLLADALVPGGTPSLTRRRIVKEESPT